MARTSDLETMGDGELLSLKHGIEAVLEGRRHEERERWRRERMESVGEGGRWLEWEHTNCGKCPRCAAGLYVHGPYWYEYRYSGGRMRSRYIGRSFSEKAAEEHGFPELAGSRPEDVYPAGVARERAEAERRYAEIVAERRARESQGRPFASATPELVGTWTPDSLACASAPGPASRD